MIEKHRDPPPWPQVSLASDGFLKVEEKEGFYMKDLQ